MNYLGDRTGKGGSGLQFWKSFFGWGGPHHRWSVRIICSPWCDVYYSPSFDHLQ